MKQIPLIIFLSILYTSVFGQITFNNRYNFDSLSNIITGILPSDSCYYAIGIIADSVNMAAPGNIFIKFDLNGEILFEKRYTSPTKTYEFWLGGLKENYKGELIALGHTIDTMRHGIMIKYNTEGDTISTKQYLSPNYNLTSDPFWVSDDFVNTSDSCIVLLANTTIDVAKDIAVFKLDSLGNTIWAKTYGTSYPEIPRVILQNDEGYLIGGMSWDQQEYYRNYIFQIDEDGNVLWEYLSPLEDKKLSANDIILTQDDEMVITTTFVKSETLIDGKGIGGIYKMDSNFNIIWKNEIRHALPGNPNYLNKFIHLKGEDNYAALGMVPYRSAWITKISSQGDSLWSRTYRYPNLPFGTIHRVNDFQSTSDGGFLICGETRGENGKGQRGWLLKLDEFGCLVPGCHIVDDVTFLEKNKIELKIYPNPTSDYLNVLVRGKLEKSIARIINLEGQVMDVFEMEAGENRTFITSVSHLTSGIYFLQIQNKDGNITSVEFIVQN